MPTPLVLDIYAASESPISGITGERMSEAIQAAGGSRSKTARYMPSFDDAAREVVAVAEDGEWFLPGRSSISHLGAQVLEHLKAREKRSA